MKIDFARLIETRRETVGLVAQTASELNFSGIVGEADVGKTAALSLALDELATRDWVVLRIDLDAAWSPNQLAWMWARELARSVIGPVAMSHLEALPTTMWPATTRQKVLTLADSLGSGVAELAEAPEPPRGVGKDAVLDGPVRATLKLAETQRILLSIDHLEAPRAARLSSPNVEKLLWRIRASGQHSRNLHVMVCCRPPAQSMAAGPQAAYHLDGRWLEIDVPTAHDFSVAADVPLQTCEKVVQLTRGHPGATLRLLEDVVTHGGSIDSAVGRVTTQSVDLARRSIQHARGIHRLGGHLLRAVAFGEGPYEATPSADPADIAEAMRRLHLNGLVRRVSARGEWVTTDPRVMWALTGRGTSAQLSLFSLPEALYENGRRSQTVLARANPAAFALLTEAERQVAEELLRGPSSNTEIADALGISTNTVRSHLQRVYRKLGVSNREEAVNALGAFEPA